MIDYNELIMVAFCSSVDVLKLTDRLCAKAVADNIPGDFCEAGCAYGAHGVVMAEHTERDVYLFDSFEGIPIHGPEDLEWTASHGDSESDPRKSGGITICKFEDVKNTMHRYSNQVHRVKFIKGWFADTLPALTDEKFSVVRLDCDLYESYKICMEQLWPRLSVGGWLIIDDWALSGCKKAVVDYLGFTPEVNMVAEVAYFQKK